MAQQGQLICVHLSSDAVTQKPGGLESPEVSVTHMSDPWAGGQTAGAVHTSLCISI